MKFNRIIAAVVAAAIMFGSTSCIGSFALTKRLLGWNENVGNKFTSELVFFAFWVLPVYEVCALADILVINSIEFWSGSNPMGVAQADRTVRGSNGDLYKIHQDASGYDITDLDTDKSMRLEYNQDDMSWMVEYEGESYTLMQYVDDTHVRMPINGGSEYMTVEVSQLGLNSYAALAR